MVFDRVTVVDVDEGKLVPDQRVVVVGNRIQTVGSTRSVPLPKGSQIVEAKGKYLIPGLWDLHVHTTAYLPYLLLIANGLTGMRDAWAYVPLDTMIRWRREILAGTRVGPPRQILSGSAIDSRPTCKRDVLVWPGHMCVSANDSADARHLVDSLKAAGVDMLKLYGLSKPMWFVIAAEARRLGIPFGGHGEDGGQITAIEASDSGASLLDHELGVQACWRSNGSIEACQEGATRFRRTGLWFAPTLIQVPILRGPGAHAVAERLTERADQFWAGALPPGNWLRDSLSSAADSSGNMAVAERVGLLILAGTDTDVGPTAMWTLPPGFALHAELAMFVADGMTPLNALRTATLNPAKFLHATDSLGTVAPGKLADLVLLDADPLADITNTTTIRAVVANGRYFDRTALDRMLVEVRAKAKEGFSYWWEGGAKQEGMTAGRMP